MRRDRQPQRVIEVRRVGATATFIWDSQPYGRERLNAKRAQPQPAPLVGHSWPGEDDKWASVLRRRDA